MSENVQDAEKAWEEHIAEVAPYPAASFPDPEAEKRGRMYKSGYMAGRASRDTEVAELRAENRKLLIDGEPHRRQNRRLKHFIAETERLRVQLAEAKAKIEQRPSPEFRDALIADRNKAESALADAQATIEAIQRLVDDDASSYLSQGGLRAVGRILSAPSSTGGTDE